MSTETAKASVELLDRWRVAMELDHARFAAHLGRHKSEWSRVWRGERPPSQALLSAALAKAPEPWKSALEKAYLADLAAVV